MPRLTLSKIIAHLSADVTDDSQTGATVLRRLHDQGYWVSGYDLRCSGEDASCLLTVQLVQGCAGCLRTSEVVVAVTALHWVDVLAPDDRPPVQRAWA